MSIKMPLFKSTTGVPESGKSNTSVSTQLATFGRPIHRPATILNYYQNDQQSSGISHWYSGRSLLITGATGFVGKALLEKLLRSCPDISRIYLLIRPKKGQTPEQRLIDLLHEPLFKKIKNVDPTLFSKVTVIKGDLSLPNLSLGVTDKNEVIEKVSVIFHCAACTDPKDALKHSVLINTIGTHHLLRLALGIRRLEAFVLISTIHSYAEEKIIPEAIVKIPKSPIKIAETISSLPENVSELSKREILDNKRNCYHFSKCLAEKLLVEEINIPSAIVRASLVVAAINEPIPGWIDHDSGLTKIIITTGKGYLRSYLGNPKYTADIIPVDIVVNCMVSAAWYRAKCSSADGNQKCKIFNCTTSNKNPITWGALNKMIPNTTRLNPFQDTFWYPTECLQQFSWLNRLNIFLFHILPASVYDIGLICIGKSPRMVSFQKTLRSEVQDFEYFTTHRWNVESTYFNHLIDAVHDADNGSGAFNLDVGQINWPEYVKNYVRGVRRYVLHQSDDSLSTARARLQKIHFVQKTVQLVLTIGFIFIFSHTAITAMLRDLGRRIISWYRKFNVELSLVDYFALLLNGR